MAHSCLDFMSLELCFLLVAGLLAAGGPDLQPQVQVQVRIDDRPIVLAAPS